MNRSTAGRPPDDDVIGTRSHALRARAPHQGQNALRSCPPLWSTRRRLFPEIEEVGLELVMRMSASSAIDQKHRVRAVVERKRGRGVGVPFIKSLGHWARNGFLVGF